MSLNHDEKLNLKKIMDETDYVDNTHNIRRLKHSKKIRDNVKRMEELKREHEAMRLTHIEGFFSIVQEECRFLYDNYTDIFNRLMKDEVDPLILQRFLIVLKMIEDGQLDQQEGSSMIGKYLKELYLDSAVRKADALERERSGEKEPLKEGMDISWKAYKALKK
tara:strand:+ start:49 stop:540 length:492 start_codon:yes stop_codon:yes gene_type:complete